MFDESCLGGCINVAAINRWYNEKRTSELHRPLGACFRKIPRSQGTPSKLRFASMYLLGLGGGV
jgi:hypothetical protein